MALLNQQLQKFLLTRLNNSNSAFKTNKKNPIILRQTKRSSFKCSAIAIEAPSSLAGVAGIRWGLTKLQGARDEMEDDAVIVQPDTLEGFYFAAVFDGHGGSSSVTFLREELYKECAQALKGELLLSGKDFDTIKSAITEAFENVDLRLSKWLENKEEEDESGATATVMLVGNDRLYIAHLGDSSAVISRSGKAEVLTDPHRPYGSNKASLQEIRRINEAGGWINNGRICGDIAISRAFGDIRFKTKKNEMVEGGVKEGRWSQKFASRVKFNGDLVVARPDIIQAVLGSDAELVVLASDGLWDYINSSEAVSFVRDELRQHGNVQQACESLANAALDRRSQDNISIIIADLGKTDWQNLPADKENVMYEFGQAFVTLGVVSLGIWLSSHLIL
ncbi:protein phosphatase 2C 57-like isoform X1 [Chenopodium quinoa]|uniref:protein-serine/threonine phosphatase n=1 Tax=Chenopodium quinoa TaxID=63459 RepID=A0A803MUP4_CHEQI|nr:protein phosphatase 2C 57-like isoform X1 [Chenopodium quinoa]